MRRILKMFRKGQNCQAIKCITWQHGSHSWPFIFVLFVIGSTDERIREARDG